MLFSRACLAALPGSHPAPAAGFSAPMNPVNPVNLVSKVAR